MRCQHLEKLFFNTLQHSISKAPLLDSEFIALSDQEWKTLYSLSAKQGVRAIVFDALDGVKSSIPKAIKIQWALGAEQIEKRYLRQERLANEISDIFSQSGIHTIALKGLAISRYYPIPQHRECGDFDCFLFERFADGNKIAELLGAEVRFDDYKHSHITYKGMMIENHKYCTPIRGCHINKDFEKYLQSQLASTPFEYLKGSSIISPSPTFNALFLARHSLTHFLYEGINVRHIVDWACLLKHEQDNILWEEFYRWCELMNMKRFVNLMNSFACRHIGIEISNPQIQLRDKELGKFVDNMLYDTNSVYNRPNLSLWQQRWTIAKNMLSNYWKFSKIYKKSLLVELTKSGFALLFEKNPKL